MQRFQVPQFIEVEDKLFGPLTFKQFVYVVGGGAIVFILWISLPKFLAVIFGVPIVAFSLGLAFYKVNGDPMVNVLSHGLQYLLGTRLYIWRKERKRKYPKKELTVGQSDADNFILPKTKRGALSDLAWSLDVQKNIKEKRAPSKILPPKAFVNNK
ncbi:MAG: PrgI family protein [Candidatus Niyogibacteria bacterium]|nr:PrgI family protein [Candidatus Niyogibacteria bacterium]